MVDASGLARTGDLFRAREVSRARQSVRLMSPFGPTRYSRFVDVRTSNRVTEMPRFEVPRTASGSWWAVHAPLLAGAMSMGRAGLGDLEQVRDVIFLNRRLLLRMLELADS